MALAKVVLSTVSVVTGLTILAHILLSTPKYVDPITQKCLLPVLAPEDNLVPFPVFDRIVCILIPYFVDCSRTDYGRLVVRLLMSFVWPICWLELVEASRVANRWSMLACMPFATLFAYSTGIGIYLPVFFVPLMIKIKSTIDSSATESSVPLARVYALLSVHILNLPFIAGLLMPGPDSVGQGNSWIPVATAIHMPLQVALWFIYTPLTALIERVVVSAPKTDAETIAQDKFARMLIIRSTFIVAHLSAVAHLATVAAYFFDRTTPVSDIWSSFSFSFRSDNLFYAPAYFLLWDYFGAVLGSFFWILSDAKGMKEPAKFLATSVVMSPGFALMMHMARREKRLLAQAHPDSDTATTSEKLKQQ
ncbi:hypothetical protein BGZ83_000852 [Gryganskiella cystojenkinii]|nr:hypothetical protein BGZ83_000852 [Gryganskiella cystojenkinii]